MRDTVWLPDLQLAVQMRQRADESQSPAAKAERSLRQILNRVQDAADRGEYAVHLTAHYKPDLDQRLVWHALCKLGYALEETPRGPDVNFNGPGYRIAW